MKRHKQAKMDAFAYIEYYRNTHSHQKGSKQGSFYYSKNPFLTNRKQCNQVFAAFFISKRFCDHIKRYEKGPVGKPDTEASTNSSLLRFLSNRSRYELVDSFSKGVFLHNAFICYALVFLRGI